MHTIGKRRGSYRQGEGGRSSRLVAVVAVLCLTVSAVSADTIHVNTQGTHETPFGTWETAATNLVDAVAAAGSGSVVLVTNGVYRLSAEVALAEKVTVTSVHGPPDTVIEACPTTRCFTVSHSNAVLSGFTITGGRAYDGGGLMIVAGAVTNCTIRGNVAEHDGGGVYLTGSAVLENCLVVSNTALWGGGVHCATGGLVRYCVVGGNYAAADGGGVRCERGGNVNTTLIVTNSAKHFGGGVACRSGGTFSGCTISGNMSLHTFLSGTFNHRGGTYHNSILYLNEYQDVHNLADGATFLYSCTRPDQAGQGNIEADPLFVASDLGDYHLQSGSPCVDVGSNALAVGSADLDGEARIANGTVDCGAYERDED